MAKHRNLLSVNIYTHYSLYYTRSFENSPDNSLYTLPPSLGWCYVNKDILEEIYHMTCLHTIPKYDPYMSG